MIKDETTSSGPFAGAGTAAPGSGYNPGAASAPASHPQPRPFSLLNMPKVGGISRSATTEPLSKSLEAATKALSNAAVDQRYAIQLLPVNNTIETRLRLSALVLAMHDESLKMVSYHTLLLEATGGDLPSEVKQIEGHTVVIDRYASEVFDDTYNLAVEQIVRQEYPNARLFNTGPVAVPRNFNWDDARLVQGLMANCLLACATYLEAQDPEFLDVDLGAAQHDASLQVAVNFDSGQITDYVGLPVRTDITVTTTAVANTRQDTSGSLNNQQDSQVISAVGGFIDLSYTPALNQPMSMGQYLPAGQQEDKRRYRARFVITRMEHLLRLTPAAQLSALASAAVLAMGTNWFRAFKPNLNAGPNDPRDPGALTIETNLLGDPSGFSPKMDTKSVQFGDQQLGGLISSTIHPGLAFSIDVSDAGTDTWYNRVFAGAAAGDIASNKEILDAANTVTSGHFARMYTGHNFMPVIFNDERVLLGYREDTNGQLLDVRTLDYLFVLNRLGSQPQEVANYSATIEKDSPQALRLHMRKTTHRALAERITYTQLGTRATINPEFMNMFLAALKAAGVNLKLVSSTSGDYLTNRPGGMLNNAAVLGGNFAVFNVGGYTGNQQAGIRPVQGQSMFSI